MHRAPVLGQHSDEMMHEILGMKPGEIELKTREKAFH